MLQELLNKHCLDPKNPQKVYDLAEEYDRIKNGAMAISLYLKAADLTQDRLLQYKAMIQIGRCYNRQGNRGYTVEGAYMDAAGIFPERPEALYYLSRFYEDRQAWKQSYYFATVGMKAHHFDDIGVEYPGIKHMAFQKAMAKWYITGTQQGRREMFDFYGKTYIEDDAAVYMREEKQIDIMVDINLGKKEFTAFTMDLTKKYIEINANYRS